MKRDDQLMSSLPESETARRFLGQLAEAHPSASAKLLKNEALLSDVLTLVSFSPLLATTLLQNPDYFWWLDRKRRESGVRGKDELLESLARFTLTNSQLEPQVLFARFRRRELLRIYLRDIRRLATIAEITEEISNLADAILDSALQLARREMDNRFGKPQETDEKGRFIPARFCIAALGKLGSRELNYSSDIDLVFFYSAEGSTSGSGSRGQVTNREYFVKLAEYVTKLVGQQTGEGAAYRVDLRLRPHGSLGAIAISLADMVRYYRTEARAWERQVLIRSRGGAGDIELFKTFFTEVEDLVFSKKETVETALANVRRSKEQIDLEQVNRRGYDVKLGRGGIREIEFLAQALQLAHGGRDKWLRSPHTLISLVRLADRKHLTETDLTELTTAYTFLRRTEHMLQMENGVQTHTVPEDNKKRELLARRMSFAEGGNFEKGLAKYTANVSRIFERVFGEVGEMPDEIHTTRDVPTASERSRSNVLASLEKSDIAFDASGKNVTVLDRVAEISPHFASMLAANPHLVTELPDPDEEFTEPDYAAQMMEAVEASRDFGQRLSAMRRTWSRFLLQIVVLDIFEKITIAESKRLQTNLAEASIAAGLRVVRDELAIRTGNIARPAPLDLAVLALGKLGGRGIDFDSDLDLVIVYYDPKDIMANITPAEFYSRAVELFVTTLSSMTRDGSLYRVDLRLRPFGSKGMSAMSIDAFLGYMTETAAVWEMLAFVKLRMVGGDASIGLNVESETRRIIHERAASLPIDELRDETLRVRFALENQRVRTKRGGDIDIKYGSGGMLDVYFAMRFLQLRDSVPDASFPNSPPYEGGVAAASSDGVVLSDRSTSFMLDQLATKGSLSAEIYEEIKTGYDFLSNLDHNLRLTIGRTTRVPLGNENALKTIATRMNLASPADLLEQLTLHRVAIRSAFENILS